MQLPDIGSLQSLVPHIYLKERHIENVTVSHCGSNSDMNRQVILTRFGLARKSHMMFLHTIKKQLRSTTTQQQSKIGQLVFVYVVFKYFHKRQDKHVMRSARLSTGNKIKMWLPLNKGLKHL